MKTAGGMSETTSDAKSLSNFIRPMVLNLQGEEGGGGSDLESVHHRTYSVYV